MFLRRSSLLLLSCATLLFGRHGVRFIDPLCGILLPQLGDLGTQLCILGFQFENHSLQTRIFRFQIINPFRQSRHRGLQLHHQLSIIRLLTRSVHARCLSDATFYSNPSFHEEMDSYLPIPQDLKDFLLDWNIFRPHHRWPIPNHR
jgi:hypothetical protein